MKAPEIASISSPSLKADSATSWEIKDLNGNIDSHLKNCWHAWNEGSTFPDALCWKALLELQIGFPCHFVEIISAIISHFGVLLELWIVKEQTLLVMWIMYNARAYHLS